MRARGQVQWQFSPFQRAPAVEAYPRELARVETFQRRGMSAVRGETP